MSTDNTSTHKINFAKDLGAQKLTKLDEEIARFDSVLDRIQKLMPEDFPVYQLIVETRDLAWKLHNKMHGCDVVNFTNGGLG